MPEKASREMGVVCETSPMNLRANEWIHVNSLYLSFCPSVWKWKAVEKAFWMPNNLQNYVNILPVKQGSLSEMSFLGSPNDEINLSANIWAAFTVDTSVVVEAKRTNLESLSTKTKIASWCLEDFGRCVTKSIDTCSQRQLGNCKGCKTPASFMCADCADMHRMCQRNAIYIALNIQVHLWPP